MCVPGMLGSVTDLRYEWLRCFFGEFEVGVFDYWNGLKERYLVARRVRSWSRSQRYDVVEHLST